MSTVLLVSLLQWIAGGETIRSGASTHMDPRLHLHIGLQLPWQDATFRVLWVLPRSPPNRLTYQDASGKPRDVWERHLIHHQFLLPSLVHVIILVLRHTVNMYIYQLGCKNLIVSLKTLCITSRLTYLDITHLLSACVKYLLQYIIT